MMRNALALATALALLGSLACATGNGGASRSRAASRAELQRELERGVDLYGAGEFVRAAGCFRKAADAALAIGDRRQARDATVAECTAWLRARELRELDPCAVRLEHFVRRDRTSDPGVNTLLAFGALAGDRPLPPHKLPNPVQSLVREAAAESQ